MLPMQQIPEPNQLLAQPFSGIIAVMQVNLNFSTALLHQSPKLFQAGRVVLLFGIEKCMLRHAAVGIAERLCHGRKLPDPTIHMSTRRCLVYPVPVGLVVVADRHHKMAHPAPPLVVASKATPGTPATTDPFPAT